MTCLVWTKTSFKDYENSREKFVKHKIVFCLFLVWMSAIEQWLQEVRFYILWNPESFGETWNNAIYIYLVWVSANQQCLPWGWNTRGTNWILRIQHFLSWFASKRVQIQANPKFKRGRNIWKKYEEIMFHWQGSGGAQSLGRAAGLIHAPTLSMHCARCIFLSCSIAGK